jgi:DNA-binding CsgD family transcriptional regulator
VANADSAVTSEVVALCQNPGARLHEQAALRRWDGGSVRDGDRLEPSPLTTTRESACPPGCRVCFLARKYGLTPREVTLIALISAGKSSRAMSQTLGIGMPKIRKYCGIIHGKIGTHSRLAIGLWAIARGWSNAQFNLDLVSLPNPLQGSACHEIQTAAEEKLLP